MTARLRASPPYERFIVTRRNDQLIAKKLVAYHAGADGAKVKFEMRQ